MYLLMSVTCNLLLVYVFYTKVQKCLRYARGISGHVAFLYRPMTALCLGLQRFYVKNEGLRNSMTLAATKDHKTFIYLSLSATLQGLGSVISGDLGGIFSPKFSGGASLRQCKFAFQRKCISLLEYLFSPPPQYCFRSAAPGFVTH